MPSAVTSTPPSVLEPELELSTSPIPVEQVLAARRAKRQAILAKYSGVSSVNTMGASPSPGPSSAVQPPQIPLAVSDPILQSRSIDGTPDVSGVTATPTVENARQVKDSSRKCLISILPTYLNYFHAVVEFEKELSPSASPTPNVFELAKEEDEGVAQADVQAQARQEGGREQISAADYDPSLDRREDEQRRVRGAKEEVQDVEMIEEEEEEEEDFDDMFAALTSEKKKVKKVKKVVVSLQLPPCK